MLLIRWLMLFFLLVVVLFSEFMNIVMCVVGVVF